MKERLLLLLVLLLFSLNLVSAKLYINEIELNPQGTDSGNEWAELYNDGLQVNLDGWYIQDKAGKNFSLPSLTITNFFVLDSLTGLNNNDEELRLFNGNFLEDQTPSLDDAGDNLNTWSRVPDGSGEFIFQQETRALPNEKISISGNSINKGCVLSTDSVQLNTHVSGVCVQEVIFSSFINQEWKNITGVKLQDDNYSAVLPSTLFSGSEIVEWFVSAKDCFGRVEQSSVEQFYVNSRTNIQITPEEPDGLNKWYVSEPRFLLENSDASQIFYQWGSSSIIDYIGQFSLENAPNSANLTGGILELNYWADICNENPQTKTIKLDLTNPIITSLIPGEGAFVNEIRPKIQATLDERYHSNSGINKSTAFMLLDGANVATNVQNLENSDVVITHLPPSGLSEGVHHVIVNVTDNSGRNSQTAWSFEIKLSELFEFFIYAPEEKLYLNKRIPINISSTKILRRIDYIDNNDENPKVTKLCENCDSFGLTKKIQKIFEEGENNITFIARDEFDNVLEKNVVFIIDSKKPKIVGTSPLNRIAGNIFELEFEEENPKNASLTYGNSERGFRTELLNLTGCQKLKKRSLCSTAIDTSDFEGEEIGYYFTLFDATNKSVNSKERTVLIDTTPPLINSISYTRNNYIFELSVNISEKNFDIAQYIDNNEKRPKLRTLCMKLKDGICKKKIKLLTGLHNIDIQVRDKAGSLTAGNIEIIV